MNGSIAFGNPGKLNPDNARPGAIPGVAYYEQADTLSFAAAREFLAEAFRVRS